MDVQPRYFMVLSFRAKQMFAIPAMMHLYFCIAVRLLSAQTKLGHRGTHGVAFGVASDIAILIRALLLYKFSQVPTPAHVTILDKRALQPRAILAQNTSCNALTATGSV